MCEGQDDYSSEEQEDSDNKELEFEECEEEPSITTRKKKATKNY